MKMLVLGSMLVIAAISGCASQRTEQRPLAQLSGVELYEQLCASCHGVDAKGDGPVAPLVKIGVPDLTRLAYRAGGEFPAQEVLRTIDGRYERHAHGPRDMPVWGWQLYGSSAPSDGPERARVDAMLARLVEHLRSVQTN